MELERMMLSATEPDDPKFFCARLAELQTAASFFPDRTPTHNAL
jgi:hypothetical protein